MNKITFQQVSHQYGTKQVLSEISLQIESGELTCLLGGSGSGKTTVLRLIAGLEVPSQGKILIDDQTVSESGQLLVPPGKREVGFIFQDLALWPHFTVYQNVAFGLKEKKVPDVMDKVLKMLQFFDIQNQAEKYPHQLSGGQQQLVAISRALVLQPKILLMDEPITGLDVKLKHRLLNHIRELKKAFNITIAYVTHDHREAFAIADRIVVLSEGKIVESGTSDEVKHSENEYVKYFLEY